MASDLPTNLLEAIRYFSNPERAFDFVKSLRWPDGQVTCPRPACQGTEHSFLATRRIWKCKKCRRQFSVKVGTIFEDSPLGWDKWLPAIWLLANSKNSVSSHELGRALGVSQKTAWFMFHRIRKAMESRTFVKLSGTVEVDETYIGGLAKNMHRSARKYLTGSGPADKAAVQGAIQRGGRVKAEVLSDLTQVRLRGNVRVRRWVEPDSTVYSDEAAAYMGLDRYFTHKSVNHTREYVSGGVHTNTMESFWALLKRSIKGTQIHVDEEHLDRYVTERIFCFDYRNASDLERMRMALDGVGDRRLTWKALTAKYPLAA